MKITIVGAGAIGGVIGAFLANAGEDITFVDIAEEHVQKMRESGLTIQENEQRFSVPVKALTLKQLIEQGEPLDTVFLSVKAQHTESAVQSFKHLLSSSSVVVSFQNGLCEQEISQSIPGRLVC